MHRTLCLLGLCALACPSVHAATIYSANGTAYTSATSSSSFSANYTPDNLFDETPTAGQEVSLSGGDVNLSFGGDIGAGPHYVEFQIDSVQNIQSLFYAQRDFNNLHNGASDKVESISLWVSDTTPFTAANPGVSAYQTFAIPASPDPRHDTDLFAEYLLNTPVNARYFLISFTGKVSETGVIGGRELRVGVPEPISLGMLGAGAFLLVRRRRA